MWRFLIIPVLILMIGLLLVLTFSNQILSYGVFRSNPGILAFSLGIGADPNQLDVHGNYPLTYAVTASRPVELAKRLLEAGADPNLMTSQGFTAFHFAAQGPSLEMLELLADHKGDLRKSNSYGEDPLLLALMQNRKENARFLLEKGADPNFESPTGITPIFLTVEMNDPGFFKLIVAKGGTKMGKNARGETALDMARKFGDDDWVKLLKALPGGR